MRQSRLNFGGSPCDGAPASWPPSLSLPSPVNRSHQEPPTVRPEMFWESPWHGYQAVAPEGAARPLTCSRRREWCRSPHPQLEPAIVGECFARSSNGKGQAQLLLSQFGWCTKMEAGGLPAAAGACLLQPVAPLRFGQRVNATLVPAEDSESATAAVVVEPQDEERPSRPRDAPLTGCQSAHTHRPSVAGCFPCPKRDLERSHNSTCRSSLALASGCGTRCRSRGRSVGAAAPLFLSLGNLCMRQTVVPGFHLRPRAPPVLLRSRQPPCPQTLSTQPGTLH